MHDVPEELGCEGIASDEQVFHLPDMPWDACEHSSAYSADSFVGVDLDEGLLYLECAAIDLVSTVSDLIAVGAKLFVDVGRLEQAVFEERTVDFHVTGEMAEADVGYLHGVR